MVQTIKCINEFPPATEYQYDEDLWNHQHGDALVIINCHSSKIYYPEHWTPLSIKCAFAGKEYYKLRNTTYAVGDNNFLIMNQGSNYASYILSESLTESLTLNFTPHNLNILSTVICRSGLQLLDDPFKLQRGTTTFIEKLYAYSPAMASFIRQLKYLIKDSSSNNFAITEILYSILEEIYRSNSIALKEAERIPARKMNTRQELYKRLSIAKDYLSSCYHEDVCLERLAATCYLNPFYLLREFKKLYHITPHQYLTRIRLEAAENLIAGSQKPIIEVLRASGFQDPTSFSKLFKKHYGSTPLAYRHRVKTHTG